MKKTISRMAGAVAAIIIVLFLSAIAASGIYAVCQSITTHESHDSFRHDH